MSETTSTLKALTRERSGPALSITPMSSPCASTFMKSMGLEGPTQVRRRSSVTRGTSLCSVCALHHDRRVEFRSSGSADEQPAFLPT